jgi:hypothetical protein
LPQASPCERRALPPPPGPPPSTTHHLLGALPDGSASRWASCGVMIRGAYEMAP